MGATCFISKSHNIGIKRAFYSRFHNFVISLIGLTAILAPQLFFSISGLIGFEYGGKEESPVYILFIVLIFVFVFIVFIFSYWKKPFLTKTEIGFYLFFFLLLLNHLLWVLLDNYGTQLLPANLIFFFSMGIPGFMAGRVILAYNLWSKIIKIAEAFFLLIGIGLIAVIVLPFLTGFHVRGIGGASYQAASYYAALSYGMIGLVTFRIPKRYRFRIFRNRLMVLINLAVMTAMCLAVLLNGGRGAFVIMAVYTVIFIYWIISKGHLTWNWFIRFMSVLLTFPILLSIALQKVFNNPILSAGWRRATAFIVSLDAGLIDLEKGSSGRDRVFTVAIRGIFESPWIGHGTFGHWEKVIQPHNLFFDLALQFGIPIAFIIIIVVLIIIVLKLRNFRNLSVEQLWVLMLFLYPLVNLMVSGGYLSNSLFWFCLLTIFSISNKCYSLKKG